MQTVNNQWPKYDPRTGFMLCEGCWNNQNWGHHCTLGMCECPKKDCGGWQPPPRKQKFNAEGQTEISMENPLTITVNS